MKFRTMLVLGLAPTCVRCDLAFLVTPESPFYCADCAVQSGPADDIFRECLADARRAKERFGLTVCADPRMALLHPILSVQSVKSVSPLPTPN